MSTFFTDKVYFRLEDKKDAFGRALTKVKGGLMGVKFIHSHTWCKRLYVRMEVLALICEVLICGILCVFTRETEGSAYTCLLLQLQRKCNECLLTP